MRLLSSKHRVRNPKLLLLFLGFLPELMFGLFHILIISPDVMHKPSRILISGAEKTHPTFFPWGSTAQTPITLPLKQKTQLPWIHLPAWRPGPYGFKWGQCWAVTSRWKATSFSPESALAGWPIATEWPPRGGRRITSDSFAFLPAPGRVLHQWRSRSGCTQTTLERNGRLFVVWWTSSRS